MTTLRVLQALLVLAAIAGFWYANRMRYESDLTVRLAALMTCSVLSLVGTQILPLAWLSFSGIEADAEITQLDCEPRQRHYVHFEFLAQGQTVRGFESNSYGAQRCESLQVGSRAPVVYIADAPRIHAWGSVSHKLGECWAVMAFVAVAVPWFSYRSLRKLQREA